MSSTFFVICHHNIIVDYHCACFANVVVLSLLLLLRRVLLLRRF